MMLVLSSLLLEARAVLTVLCGVLMLILSSSELISIDGMVRISIRMNLPIDLLRSSKDVPSSSK